MRVVYCFERIDEFLMCAKNQQIYHAGQFFRGSRTLDVIESPNSSLCKLYMATYIKKSIASMTDE